MVRVVRLMWSDQQPSTLSEAHDVVWQMRPKQDADPLEWVAFHRRSAEVYSRTSKIDLRHQYEATQCAGIEIRRAREIEHRLNPEDDDA
jgi:hypothetical protein